ncbi:unnamed protein product [Brassicogethes aeneus]|uniref:Lipase domain-containing protein n=1 Tax=Brassicogethes aeneus TaxID=1431903 RepID=A0A9P0FG02_BRAAE|nr:unnamed protein product [Brassicogethes aeneus]
MVKRLKIIIIISTFTCLVSVTETVQHKEYYRSLPPVDYSLANAEKNDVKYRLFTNISDETGTFLTEESVKNINIKKYVPTIVLIHGWTTNDTSPWYPIVKNKYFEKGTHNIIYINWQKAGNLEYDVSSANIKPVGKYIAEFLIKSGIQREQVHIIGHSLGSQLASFIGKFYTKLTGEKLGRITGLDPAGPKFEHPLLPENLHLSQKDAEFVDVIHTDIEWFGYTMPIGHIDFYPNNGGHQPGCPTREIDDNCSHARSTLYFAESISKSIVATECTIEAEDTINIKTIEGGKQVIFGQKTNKKARGSYVFSTNSEKLFL